MTNKAAIRMSQVVHGDELFHFHLPAMTCFDVDLKTEIKRKVSLTRMHVFKLFHFCKLDWYSVILE